MTGTKGLLPPGQRVHHDFPRFGLPWYAHRSPHELTPISVELVGADGAGAVLDDAALAGLTRHEQRSDFQCVTTFSSTPSRSSTLRNAGVHVEPPAVGPVHRAW